MPRSRFFIRFRELSMTYCSLRIGRTPSVFLLLALLSACSEHPVAPEPIRAVRVMTVAAGPITAQQEYAAELLPQAESRLGFRVGGKVVRRTVQVGQQVKAGQLLAQLDGVDYRLAADASKAQVASAQANLELASAEFKRYTGLREQNFISAAELERREANYKAALFQLQQTQAQAASQGNQTAYTSLFADVSGVVTAVDMELGQVVGAATPVVRVAQDGPRDAVFAVPEDTVGSIQLGMPADVRVWASGAVLPGVVREIAPSADPITRTFTVKVVLKSKESPPLGTTVSVLPRFNASAASEGIKLPTSALYRAGERTAVWVLDGSSMTVKKTEIALGGVQGSEVLVTSGIKAGDQIVTAGVHVLTDGQKVAIYQPKTAPATTAAATTAAAK